MCCLLVSGFLTEITQQIHSLRASGVISSHLARAAGSEVRAFRKSAGTLCTAPAETAFLVMDFILHRYGRMTGSPISLLISTGAQLSRGAPTPHSIGPPPFQLDFVLLTALLHMSVIVLCCFGLGIRHPWTWYKESSIRAQRAAYEPVESFNVEPE